MLLIEKGLSAVTTLGKMAGLAFVGKSNLGYKLRDGKEDARRLGTRNRRGWISEEAGDFECT
mgnify:CR=1 FL=1